MERHNNTASHSLIGRRFVAGSVLVHLLAIFLLPGMPPAATPPLPLIAQLRPALAENAPPVVAAATAAPAAAVRRTQPATPSSAQKIIAATPAETPPTRAATASAETAPLTEPAGANTAAAALPTTDAAALPPPLAALTALAPPEVRERRGKPSTLWLANYTQQLSGQVGRQKQYPQIARLRGWEGTAIIAIQLSAAGHIVGTKIAQSTGHDVLDQQALTMIRQAGPLPPLPYAIAGEALTVQLPIVFTLAAKD